MTIELRERPYNQGERGILLASRVLATSLLTAVLGTIENWGYERFFAPELYAAGPPFARATWLIALTLPFVLVGLLIVGLPTAFVLRRVRLESALIYAAVGAVTGALFGAIWSQTGYGYAVSAFYGCACALIWWALRPKG